MVPVAEASSAYHTWRISPVDRCMSGRKPRAYTGIASGSPGVVPSLDFKDDGILDKQFSGCTIRVN